MLDGLCQDKVRWALQRLKLGGLCQDKIGWALQINVRWALQGYSLMGFTWRLEVKGLMVSSVSTFLGWWV